MGRLGIKEGFSLLMQSHNLNTIENYVIALKGNEAFNDIKIVETTKGKKRPKIVYEIWVTPPMYGKLARAE
jgi:hypothetical protein